MGLFCIGKREKVDKELSPNMPGIPLPVPGFNREAKGA
jgi:hypothetical protein